MTLTVNGTQSCTATTNANGVATCPVTPNEPAGTYSLTGSFGGDTTTTPMLLPTRLEHLHGDQGTDHRDLHGEHVDHQRELAPSSRPR